MKPKLMLLIFAIGFFYACNPIKKQTTPTSAQPDNTLTGKWVRIGQTGPICLNFKEDGLVEGDVGNNQTIDVISKYELAGDTIKFIDIDGQMCQGYGQYKVYQTDYYISLDLIDDECGGRIKSTMGFWTKPNYEDFIETLEKKISESPKPEFYLNRARIYLATGNVKRAKDDFDTYILSDTLNARAYTNRAGTRFPDDLQGVVLDCNRAILLEPNNKNAYFLRGLARYELGEKEQGCEDFTKAIELGFSVLRIAEQEKCIGFWEKK